MLESRIQMGFFEKKCHDSAKTLERFEDCHRHFSKIFVLYDVVSRKDGSSLYASNYSGHREMKFSKVYYLLMKGD